jgi:hypothetical protein
MPLSGDQANALRIRSRNELVRLRRPGGYHLPEVQLAFGRKNLSSSGTGGTGGTKYTAELLAFAAEHGITADVAVLPSAPSRGGTDPAGEGRRALPLRPGPVRPLGNFADSARPAGSGMRLGV